MPRFDRRVNAMHYAMGNQKKSDAITTTYNDFKAYFKRRLELCASLEQVYSKRIASKSCFMPGIRAERECIQVLSKALEIWYEQKQGEKGGDVYA